MDFQSLKAEPRFDSIPNPCVASTQVTCVVTRKLARLKLQTSHSPLRSTLCREYLELSSLQLILTSLWIGAGLSNLPLNQAQALKEERSSGIEAFWKTSPQSMQSATAFKAVRRFTWKMLSSQRMLVSQAIFVECWEHLNVRFSMVQW